MITKKNTSYRCQSVNQTLFLKAQNQFLRCLEGDLDHVLYVAVPLGHKIKTLVDSGDTRQFLPQVGCVWQVPVHNLCVICREAYSRVCVALLHGRQKS